MTDSGNFKPGVVWRKLPVFVAVMFLLSGCYQPAAVFSETEHDFGAAPQKTTLKHTFAFTNAGNAPLRIDRINSG